MGDFLLQGNVSLCEEDIFGWSVCVCGGDVCVCEGGENIEGRECAFNILRPLHINTVLVWIIYNTAAYTTLIVLPLLHT